MHKRGLLLIGTPYAFYKAHRNSLGLAMRSPRRLATCLLFMQDVHEMSGLQVYAGHTRNADLRSVEVHYATTMFIHSAYVHALPLVHSSIQLIYSSKYMYDLSVLLVSMLIARNVIACSILRFWFHCYYSLCICTSMLCVWLFQS